MTKSSPSVERSAARQKVRTTCKFFKSYDIDHSPARIRRTSPSPSPIRERPRERIVEHVDMDYHSPRSSHDTLLIAPSQHRSHSRRRSHSRHHRDVSETDIVETVTRPRPRSVSYHSPDRRLSSPMRIVDRHDDFVESDRVRTGPLAVVVRPRDEEDLGYDLIRDTEVRDNMGDREKIHEVRRERRGKMFLVQRSDKDIDVLDHRSQCPSPSCDDGHSNLGPVIRCWCNLTASS